MFLLRRTPRVCQEFHAKWTQELFNQGPAQNLAKLASFEADLKDHRAQKGLAGSLEPALDLCGAYLKNYALDKCRDLLTEIKSECQARQGSLWVQFLNFQAALEMKEGSPDLAKTSLLEMIDLLNENPQLDLSRSVVFQNLSMACKTMGDYAGAIDYLHASLLDPLTWMHLWEMGKLMALLAFESRDLPRLQTAYGVTWRAYTMFDEEDPILKAKLLSSLGDNAFGLAQDCMHAPATSVPGHALDAPGDLDDPQKCLALALNHYQAAFDMTREAVGPDSPLTSFTAKALGTCQIQAGQHEEGQAHLFETLDLMLNQETPPLEEVVPIFRTLSQGPRGLIGAPLVGITQRAFEKFEAHPQVSHLKQAMAQCLVFQKDPSCQKASLRLVAS